MLLFVPFAASISGPQSDTLLQMFASQAPITASRLDPLVNCDDDDPLSFDLDKLLKAPSTSSREICGDSRAPVLPAGIKRRALSEQPPSWMTTLQGPARQAAPENKKAKTQQPTAWDDICSSCNQSDGLRSPSSPLGELIWACAPPVSQLNEVFGAYTSPVPEDITAGTQQHDQPSEAHKANSSPALGRAAASEEGEQQRQDQELHRVPSLSLEACSPLTSSSTGFMSHGRLVTSGFDVIPIKQQPKHYS